MRKDGFDNDGLRSDILRNNNQGKSCQGEDGLVRDDPRDIHGKEIFLRRKFWRRRSQKTRF